MKHESTDLWLNQLVEGTIDDTSLAALIAEAEENPELAGRIGDELSFSELIRQALDDRSHGVQTDFHKVLEAQGREKSELQSLVSEGKATSYDYDQIVKDLWGNPAATQKLRRDLVEDEWLSQVLSEPKSEGAFIEALETRMWAETKQDHFVDDFTLRLEQEFAESDEEDKVVDFPSSVFPTIVRMTAVAAAIAVGAFFAVQQISGRVDFSPAVASISKASGDVSWSQFSSPDSDGSVKSGMYHLDSGVVSLTMASGSEITVEGPALFEVRDDASAHVHAGVALARIAPNDMGISLKSKGLSISDPARLVGIDARSANSSEALFFNGGGGVCLDGGAGCRNLFEREAVKADQGGDRFVDIPFNPHAFSKAWALLSGVERNIGSVRIEMPGSEIGPSKQVENEVQVFVENESFRPESDLEVDSVEVGEFASVEVNPGQNLQAKGDLRSYLLQLWPSDGNGADHNGEVEASLTFDHPVVGVIYSSDRLTDSDASVGSSISHVGEAFDAGRGLDSGNDQILLSEDRRTLNLKLKGGIAEIDQIRVLVALN
ncbi:hypothetical protein N9B73_10380 [Verrucomicrobiales bacterium]|nr:hypothetical protein [Verrucomicrobiales bacterium]